MNLQSPIFDMVRVPARSSLARLIEAVCKQHGIEPVELRRRRRRIESSEIMKLRRDILVAARSAKYPPSAISYWFSHRDNSTVATWLEDMEIE